MSKDYSLESWERWGYQFASGKEPRLQNPDELNPEEKGSKRAEEKWEAWDAGIKRAKIEEMEAGDIASAEGVSDGVVKFDGGKSPMSVGVIRRFPLALQQIALISEYGQRKYGTYDGWEKLPNALERYADGGARHDSLVASEGEYDVGDSGLPHRGQKAWNALAELELALREGVVEMSSGNEIVDGKPTLGSNGRTNET